MKLIVTIDTEEDNWGRYSAHNNPVTNIQQIIPLQKLFDEFGVKPTYLVNYPVSTAPGSVSVLKKIMDTGSCEIGMHCHPWNTPPFDKKAAINKDETMLCNLSAAMVHEKLGVLYEAIEKNFDIVPFSFRAGRWGFSREVARWLVQSGFRVDTSITPYVDWESCHESNFSQFSPEPFWFHVDDDFRAQGKNRLLEVPASIDFLQNNSRLCQKIMKACEKPFVRRMHMKGVLDRLGLVNKIWLSPEMEDFTSMKRLARSMERKKYPCVNFFFHSNTLLPGLSPFTRSWKDVDVFIQKIRRFLVFAQEAGWKSSTLSQFAQEYADQENKEPMKFFDSPGPFISNFNN